MSDPTKYTYPIGNEKAALDHAQSFRLRIAVLSILKESDASLFDSAYYWAAYARAYGMNVENAAFFGTVQATL